MKRKVHYRYKLSWVDLKGDGRFNKERLKGPLKKDFQRSTRNKLKRDFRKELLEET